MSPKETSKHGKYEREVTKIQGCRPKPRDGHTGIVLENCMLIFGGDRHTRAHNDIYILNLLEIMMD